MKTKFYHLKWFGPRVFLMDLLLFGMLFLSACSSLRNGGAPEQSFDIDKDLEALASEFKQSTQIKTFYANFQPADPNNPTPAEDAIGRSERNKFITARLVMVDLRYIQFIRNLTRDRQLIDSATDIAIMSLNLAGAGVGSAAAKTVLHALSAGISGAKVTIDRDFFYEKTVPALIASMNAQRAAARIPILEGLSRDMKSYPFHTAVVDVQSYYEAGTFVGALNAIQAEAGAKEAQKKQEIQEIMDRGEDYYMDIKKIVSTVKRLQSANLTQAWNALKPLADPWGAAQTPPVTFSTPPDVATFRNYFNQVYPKLTPDQRTTLYQNLLNQGLITP